MNQMYQNKTVRPINVGIAVKLLYISLGIQFVNTVLEMVSIHAQKPSSLFLTIMTFITFFLLWVMWFVIYMIGRGHNWGRLTFLVFFAVGMLLFRFRDLQDVAANPIFGLLGIAQTAIQIIALVFLFQKSSSDWFRERKRTKLPSQ